MATRDPYDMLCSQLTGLQFFMGAQLKEFQASVVDLIDRKLRPSSSPTISLAAQGAHMLELLNRADDPRTTRFQSVADGASVVPVEAIRQVKLERQLVQYLTPYLQTLFPTRVLVNSEEYPWLQVAHERKYDQKPDVFFCHPACTTKKDKNPWCVDEGLDREFGTLTSMKLLDDVFIGDCKCAISAAAFGECVNHLHIIATRLKGPSRGFLFDWQSCWLLEVDTNGSVTQRVTLRWDQVRMFEFVLCCVPH